MNILNIENNINGLKCCKRCGIAKNKDNDYYHDKAGYCQSYCKICIKSERRRYKMNGNYKKRHTGLLKMAPEIQQLIISMNSARATMRDMSKASNISYATLQLWRAKGII